MLVVMAKERMQKQKEAIGFVVRVALTHGVQACRVANRLARSFRNRNTS